MRGVSLKAEAQASAAADGQSPHQCPQVLRKICHSHLSNIAYVEFEENVILASIL